MRWSFKGKKILITGGASGIGRIMARKACERGISDLIIWDNNSVAMEEISQLFEPFETAIHYYHVDLKDKAAISSTAAEIISKFGSLDLIINNAGIIFGKYFLEHNQSEILTSFEINTFAPMYITMHFLPGMISADKGIICNISSMASLIGNTRMSAYLASKWALTGWSESLRLEMAQRNKNIHILTVMPFFISTGMFEGVRSRIIPILNPETVAEKTLHAIERKKAIIAMPLPYWFIRLCQGFFPIKIFDWVMKNIFGIYDSMNTFTGRDIADSKKSMLK